MITACFARVLQRMYEPQMRAFSPHVSRGYTNQQNSQPVICQEHTSASPAVTPHEAIAGVASSYSPSCATRLVAQAHPAALDPQPLPRESLRLRQ